VRIRDATEDDLPAIVAVYDRLVAAPSVIWRDDPTDLADRRAWFEGRRRDGYPVLVVEADDGSFAGYGSFGDFRPFPGYHATVEHSVHLDDGHRGRGLGQALLDALIERARALDKAVLVAGVDAANHGSLRFHERNGFVETGRMPGVGRKFGAPVDLVLLQLDLGPDAYATPPSTAAPDTPPRTPRTEDRP
jgi:L-amino acid N-acyltransferase